MAQSERSPATTPPRLTRRKGKIRAIGVALGLTIAALVFSTIFSLLVAIPLFVMGFDIASTVVIVSLLIGGQIGFFATGYLYSRRYELPIRIKRPGRRDLSYAAAGIVAALVFATGAGVVLNWLGLIPEAVIEELVTQNPRVVIWMVVLSVIVVAPAEEYLFRGVIQGRLRQTFSAPSAIIIASLLFGSIHFGNYIGSLSTVIGWTFLIAGVGVVFGVLYERTNTLTVPIIAHATYNAILFTVGYFML